MISPLGSSAETVQTPETDTSLVKTMTVLQSTRPGTNIIENSSQSVERGSHEVCNREGSIRSSGGTDKNVYCEDNLRSLSESEIQTVVEVSEESTVIGWSCY